MARQRARGRGVIRIGILALVVSAAAGCAATGRAAGAGGPAGRPGSAAPTATARPAQPREVLGPPGGSPALARKLAGQMLASLILPPGARRTRPGSLREAEQIGSRNLIDVSRFFRVPMSLSAAADFFRAHLPAGTVSAGNGTGSGPAPADNFESVTYALRRVPPGIDQQNELLVTMQASPHGGTVVRADAEVIWYPWRTAAEYVRPAAYRSVTVTVSFHQKTHPNKIVSRTRTFTAQPVIARIAAVLNDLHASVGGVLSCPPFGAQYRLTFTPAAASPPITVTPAFCQGDDVTVAGRRQPVLSDIGSTKVLAVVAPLLGVPRNYW